MSKDVLPQRLYVQMEDDGDGDFFPVSNIEPHALEADSQVGIYELKDIKTVRVTRELV